MDHSGQCFWKVSCSLYSKIILCRLELEKVDLAITDTLAFQILNEAMKGMKHVVIYLTIY